VNLLGTPHNLASVGALRAQIPTVYRDSSLIRNTPPPEGHHAALDIVLLLGPRGALFLMSEVPLYRDSSLIDAC